MKFLLILFTFASITFVNAQNRATLENFRADKAVCEAFAERSIVELKNGELLVRLDFRQREVDYHLSKGNSKEAEKLVNEQHKINAFIIKAFRENYSFSSVHFFALKDSEHLVSGQFDSITFYTTSFEIDSTFRPNNGSYLIAEFGRTRQDTIAYYNDNVPNTSKENPKQKSYYGGGKNARNALIVMDRAFNQIREPFPYFAGYSQINSLKNRFGGAVMRLDYGLHRYFVEVYQLEGTD